MNFPKFSNLNPADIVPTIDEFLDKNRQTINQLLKNPTPNWDNLFAPLEILDNELSNYWSIISHLNSVQNSPKLREAYNTCLPKIIQYHTEFLQNEQLFIATVAISNATEFKTLETDKQQSIHNRLRDFKLSGVHLSKTKKNKYQEINLKLSELGSKFSENVLDCTNAWRKNIKNIKNLAGIPKATLNAAKTLAKSNNETGFSFSLEFPVYYSVMQYADNRDLRFVFYEAYNTKASDVGQHDLQYDNSKIMQDLLQLKQQKAKILGFDSYTQLSIQDKMADETAEVFEFLNDLMDKSLGLAKIEFDTLAAFAKTFGIDEIAPWDVAYYAEKLKQKLFNFSAEDLRPWFPIDKTLGGLFELTERLFQVKICEEFNRDTWHKDVRVFKISRNDDQIKAYFYLDLYARKNKRGGAWMDVCREQLTLESGKLQIPIAYLSCNFTAPTADTTALLTFDEVTTLFHEFGHGIHHMLSEINTPSVGGINGVPWDAVELPSQFMENFCWQKEVLPMISGHYKTAKPLPKEKLQGLLDAKNFRGALAMVRQLEFALFDFEIHHHFSENKNFIETVHQKIKQKTYFFKTETEIKFANGFTHIFGGGYSAGYYSYKWAEVLSADAFSLFEKEGILNPETAQKFLHHILQKGGSENIMDLFVKFRGRKPNIKSLLKHSGIV